MYPSLLNPFLTHVVAPLAAALFPDAGMLDHHRSFIVQYRQGGDVDLATHYDDAEVSVNIALSPESDFEGGELLLGGLNTDEHASSRITAITPVQGSGVMHLGAQLHSAAPIEKGRRLHLIMWCRSSERRKSQCAMCGRRRS